MKDFFYSFIVPCYNEENNILIFMEKLTTVLANMDCKRYEIIFINDGSQDNTLNVLKKISLDNPNIVIIDLSRNFGKEAALTAGLLNAKGDLAIPMDVDLQDPPDLIPKMIETYKNNDVDAVLCKRASRNGDSFLKSLTANLFYRIYNLFSYPPLPSNVGDFRLLNRNILIALREFPESCRFMKGIFASLGLGMHSLNMKDQLEKKERVNIIFGNYGILL